MDQIVPLDCRIVDFSFEFLDDSLGLFVKMLRELQSSRRGPELSKHVFDNFHSVFFDQFPNETAPYCHINLAFVTSLVVGYSILCVKHDINDGGEFIVYVTPTARNNGVGALLTQKVVMHADGMGLRNLYSIVAPGARSSKSALEKAGFKAEELKMTRALR